MITDKEKELASQVWTILKQFDKPTDAIACLGMLFYKIYDDSNLSNLMTFQDYLNRLNSVIVDEHLHTLKQEREKQKE